jgi:hypothetical protein
MVSKFILGEVGRSILSNRIERSVASSTIFITKAVLWFSAGRVWSVGSPFAWVLDTQHHEKVDQCWAPYHTSALTKIWGLTSFELVQESGEVEVEGRREVEVRSSKGGGKSKLEGVGRTVWNRE